MCLCSRPQIFFYRHNYSGIFIIMSTSFLNEGGKRLLPTSMPGSSLVDCIVDKEQSDFEILNFYTQYLSKLLQESNSKTEAVQIEDDIKVSTKVAM